MELKIGMLIVRTIARHNVGYQCSAAASQRACYELPPSN